MCIIRYYHIFYGKKNKKKNESVCMCRFSLGTSKYVVETYLNKICNFLLFLFVFLDCLPQQKGVKVEKHFRSKSVYLSWGYSIAIKVIIFQKNILLFDYKHSVFIA